MKTQRQHNIREIQDQDISWIKDLMVSEWGGESIVVHGDLFFPHELAGFIALIPFGKPVGLVTYQFDARGCEIITLNSLKRNRGIGTSLVVAVMNKAKRNGCKTIYMTTTNDNHQALVFYQKKGFEIIAIHRGAVDQARKIKPSIPQISPGGNPIRDEIELELMISSADRN